MLLTFCIKIWSENQMIELKVIINSDCQWLVFSISKHALMSLNFQNLSRKSLQTTLNQFYSMNALFKTMIKSQLRLKSQSQVQTWEIWKIVWQEMTIWSHSHIIHLEFWIRWQMWWWIFIHRITRFIWKILKTMK